jgi:signal transduction histidine kinase/AraC-like DNA-binding protein/ActR/RegA family two-component response regulator
MKHLLLTLCFFCVITAGFTQNQVNTDSLVQELKQLKENTRKEKLALRITFLLVLSASALALIFGTGYRNRKKAEAAQIAASKDREFAMHREQLYVNVTHELRTPLTLIISPLEKLALENPHPLVNMALKSARELELRFNDILKWNKLEANAMSVVTTIGSLEQEIQSTVNKFLSSADEKKVLLHFQPSAQEHWMELDFEKLQTILSNLLVNALKFTSAGNKIWIETEFFEKKGASFFQLSVSNNGEDIPPELLPSIFERFTQADKSQPHAVGSGIGLALARGLTELMSGKIEARSEQGTGAVFRISLPYRMAEKEPLTLQSLPAEPAAEVDKKELIQVLVIEDNPELRDFITYSFSNTFEIIQAADAATGFQSAVENLPDMIISDIMLPGGEDGIALCERLKKNPLTCHIPVLILTAKTNFDTKKAALKAGAEAYMTKPFSVEELELTIRSLFQNRLHIQENLQRTLFLNTSEKSAAGTPFFDPFIEDTLIQISENLDDPKFGVEELAQMMRISRVQLYKKVKTLTGIPPADLLRNIRLEKAWQMLKDGDGNVSQIAYSTGFDNPNYFSKAFKKHFGVSPSEIAANRLN